jgi:RNA polymerase sigma-70 factor (ECF subfamily)
VNRGENRGTRPPADDGPGSLTGVPRGDIDRLLSRHLPSLTAFVRLRLGPLIRANESCADIVQSACREVLVHADRFRFGGETNFRHWLFKTALRKITDRKRYYLAEKRKAPEKIGRGGTSASTASVAECYGAFTSPSRAAMRAEDVAALENAFDKLSPEDRDVVVLARIVGMTNTEIAKETGQTPGAVRTRLSRALAKLAVLMKAREAKKKE